MKYVPRRTIVPLAVDGRSGATSETTGALTASMDSSRVANKRTGVVFVKAHRAQSVEDYETWEERETAPTLNVFDVGDGRATAVVLDAEESLCSCCPVDPKPDSNRYKACGNAVTVPVITSIGFAIKKGMGW